MPTRSLFTLNLRASGRCAREAGVGLTLPKFGSSHFSDSSSVIPFRSAYASKQTPLDKHSVSRVCRRQNPGDKLPSPAIPKTEESLKLPHQRDKMLLLGVPEDKTAINHAQLRRDQFQETGNLSPAKSMKSVTVAKLKQAAIKMALPKKMSKPNWKTVVDHCLSLRTSPRTRSNNAQYWAKADRAAAANRSTGRGAEIDCRRKPAG